MLIYIICIRCYCASVILRYLLVISRIKYEHYIIIFIIMRFDDRSYISTH